MNGIRRYNPKQLFTDGVLGQYSVGANTGLLLAATPGEIFQFRWPDSLRLCVVRRVTLFGSVSAPFGASPATALQYDMVRATSWTVQGTGGTVLDTTTGTGKRRSQMPTSLLTAGDMRIMGVAYLGAGTKTLDSLPMATINGVLATGAVTPVVDNAAILDFKDTELDYPLVLAQNEGFVIRVTSDPGTGSFFTSVSVEWLETNAS